MDITQLTLEQMVELQKQLESALPNMKKQQLDKLRISIKEQIESAGLTLDEVLSPLLPNRGGKKANSNGSSSRKPAAVKYRLGDQHWTGKGRTPAWVTKYTAGDDAKLEELRVRAEKPE